MAAQLHRCILALSTSREAGELAPLCCEVVNVVRGIDVGLVELANQGQRTHHIGREVLGKVEEVTNGGLGIGVGSEVEGIERRDIFDGLDGLVHSLLDGRWRILSRRDGLVDNGLDGLWSSHFLVVPIRPLVFLCLFLHDVSGVDVDVRATGWMLAQKALP